MINSYRPITMLVVLVLTLVSGTSLFAQSNYQKAWEQLNAGDVPTAVKLLETVKKSDPDKAKALLTLSLLKSYANEPKEASKHFREFYEMSEDPYPELYTLWFEDAVSGSGGKKKPYQVDLMEALDKDPRNKGKLDIANKYWLGTHHLHLFDNKKMLKYYEQINSIKDWAFLGPFDNVMNSGFDKDFGVLTKMDKGDTFESRYGSPVSWFDPPLSQSDGYIFKDMYFRSSSSIIYAQTFVNAPAAQEAIMKFGYSGSLKIWLNDALIYKQDKKRRTEIDYFKYAVQLNKGYNRILVQLGDYNERGPNFTVRFTDSDHNPISFPAKTDKQSYTPSTDTGKAIPYFAMEAIKAKAEKNPDDLLYQLLLAMAYQRTFEMDAAEQILKESLEKQPSNYLILRNMILMYSKIDNSTEQNRIYDIFKDKYPDDRDVLINKISDFAEKKDNKKVKELIGKFQNIYDDEYKNLQYDILLASTDEDYEKALKLSEQLYNKFPEDYTAVTSKYRIEKSLHSNPTSSNKILETYLKDNYNYGILTELANNYAEEGKINNAKKLLEKNIDLVDYDIDSYRLMINLLSKQSKYREALEIAEKIIENKPSDYSTLSDMAVLNKFLNNNEEAIDYYEKSLMYYPFSFETNEKIRELKGKKKAVELIADFDYEATIKDYEENFKTDVKKSYDIVADQYSVIVYKTNATGKVRRYLIKINDESAIENWQQLNFGSSGSSRTKLNEAKTIKENGNTIDAERTGSQTVFTNLEIGDYIYVDYTESQTQGGKSSKFFGDSYNLNSYYPIFQLEYNIFVEEGKPMQNTIWNGDKEPVVKLTDGFNHYQWKVEAPEVIKDEPFTPPFSDVSQKVHISADYKWYDIAQWYSDLSGYQARTDFTIRTIVKDLFEGGKTYTEEEKAKKIYDFVCKNIQYSSIDFRQSSHIPQRASKVYHSRLGDCKDVSTLYASIAREAGLEANLVLINTANNGIHDVILPSLNFNHCIVKVKADDQWKFLELTDPNLPYGHLYYYHKDAAILEIPNGSIPKDISLTQLALNEGFDDNITRKTTVMIDLNQKMTIEKNVIKTGTNAAGFSRSYYSKSIKEGKDMIKSAIASYYNSVVTVTDLEYKNIEPLEAEAIYRYKYTVDKEIMKIGSFRSVKIPFGDVLAKSNIIENEERVNDFDFVYYEDTDRYDETFEVTIDPKYTFVEIPEDIELSYKGNHYKMAFNKVDDQHLNIQRTYTTKQENIPAEEFKDFQNFITQVIEAENTHLVFK